MEGFLKDFGVILKKGDSSPIIVNDFVKLRTGIIVFYFQQSLRLLRIHIEEGFGILRNALQYLGAFWNVDIFCNAQEY